MRGNNGTLWVIVSKDDYGKIYWSSHFGWVTIEFANCYTTYQKRKTVLPTNGTRKVGFQALHRQ